MEIFVFYQKIIRALVLYFLLNSKANIQKMSSYKAQMRKKKNLIIYQYQNRQETQAKVKEKKKIIKNTFKII